MAHDVEHQAGAAPKVVERVHTPGRERRRTGPRRAVAHGVAGTVGTDGETNAVTSSAGASGIPDDSSAAAVTTSHWRMA